MLTNLHVKNLALIEEADINFFDGLNIMTGETGAGKSIILGSVNIALGGKVTADIIRKGAEYALTELAFHIDDKKKIAALKDMDIEDAQDGDVIISRKIMPGRSQIKVNGMICTVSQVKSIASLLIDIHGQHDSQLLLKESSHLDMIDLYGGSTVSDVRKRYDVVYKQYREALSQLEQMDTDEESRQREISFIEFELHEIASADLKRGEDEELESRFRKMSNSQRIISDLSTAVQLLSEGSDNVMDMMGIAVKSVIEASSFDESLKSVADSCSCAEDMISDVCRQISDYVNDSSYDEEEYKEVEERLDMINSFKQYFFSHNQECYENPSPGNHDGGITTLEEKSLGCIQKGGKAVITDVLEYGEHCKKQGLNLLTGPGNDIVSTTNLTAAGANIILFTTGRGTPLGASVPTIKVASNSRLAKRKSNWIDFNAGELIESNDFENMTEEIFKLLIDIASGRKTKNEQNGYRDISIFKDGVIM